MHHSGALGAHGIVARSRQRDAGLGQSREREPMMVVEADAAALLADVLDEAGLHDPDHAERSGAAPVGRTGDARVLEPEAMIVVAPSPRDDVEHVERTRHTDVADGVHREAKAPIGSRAPRTLRGRPSARRTGCDGRRSPCRARSRLLRPRTASSVRPGTTRSPPPSADRRGGRRARCAATPPGAAARAPTPAAFPRPPSPRTRLRPRESTRRRARR